MFCSLRGHSSITKDHFLLIANWLVLKGKRNYNVILHVMRGEMILYKEMSFQECILDSLADVSKSIVQIEGYFRHTTYKTNRAEIKDVMVQLLNDGLIQIVYPPNKAKEDFIKSNTLTIEAFWFEQTQKGKEIWNEIEF
jgi:hypothetical protein